MRIFPIAPQVPSNACGTDAVNQPKHLGGIAVVSQAFFNSRDPLGPRSVDEDVKNSGRLNRAARVVGVKCCERSESTGERYRYSGEVIAKPRTRARAAG